MARAISIYLTVGKPGQAIAICRLDNPEERLIREIGEGVYEKLLREARQLRRKRDFMAASVKAHNAWMLRVTLHLSRMS